MDLTQLFWYPVHVERTVRYSVSSDMIEDTIEIQLEQHLFNDLSSTIWQFWEF